jgi:hypothetical protein
MIVLHPAARGGHVPSPWQRKATPVTQYAVKAISSDARRVLLEADNGISTWFDTAAILISFVIGQTLEISEVMS